MSSTPRTDAAVCNKSEPGSELVPAHFARQLERELVSLALAVKVDAALRPEERLTDLLRRILLENATQDVPGPAYVMHPRQLEEVITLAVEQDRAQRSPQRPPLEDLQLALLARGQFEGDAEGAITEMEYRIRSFLKANINNEP